MISKLKKQKKSIDDYDTYEGPDDHDYTKWPRNTNVVLEFYYTAKTKRKMKEIESDLDDNHFQLSEIFKQHDEWNQKVWIEIKLSQSAKVEKLVDEIFDKHNSSHGHITITKNHKVI